MATGTTAIRSPTDDLGNHTIVLRQLKEVAEVGQRLRGDPTDSFVKVSELVSAGIARFVNNIIQAPPTSSGGAGTVSVADSITGTGASASPLQLSGDSASPGNSMVYGTNGSGTKGWYAATGGSTTLSALTDVSISSPSNGQPLTYNSAISKWVNGSALTLVQKSFTRTNSGSSGTVTLSTTPVVGNVLVAMGAGFDNGSSTQIGLPTGFTSLAHYIVSTTQGINIGVRVVQSGDGTSWGFTGGNGGDTYGIFEFSGMSDIQVSQVTPSTSGFVLTSPLQSKSPVGYTFGIVEADSTNAYSSISGATLIFDGSNVAGNHPSVVYQVTQYANVAVTFSTTSSFGSIIGALCKVY